MEVLKIATPVVKLLRLCDGAAPAMGKVMPRMNSIRGVIANSTVPWKEGALKIHDARWEYLKSPMHLAGYALDPEYLAHDMSGDIQEALISIIEKMAMRYEYSRLTSNPDSLSGPMLARARAHRRRSGGAEAGGRGLRRARVLPGQRGRSLEAIREGPGQDAPAGALVEHVRQEPPGPLQGRVHGALAAGLRVGSGAQLVDLRLH